MRVHQIDALRGLAALLVAAVFHIHYLVGPAVTLCALPGFAWLHDNGWTLVDLFFVISGFIFAEIYLDDGHLKGSFGDFAIARIARLYPLHLVTLLAMLTIAIAGWRNPEVALDPRHFALNLLMLQDSGLNDGMSFNFPSWSISVEVFCYVLFAIAARLRCLPLVSALLIALGLYLTVGPDKSADHIGRGLVGFFAGYMLHQLRPRLPAWLLTATVIVSLSVTAPINPGAFYSFTLWPAIILLTLKTRLRMQWLGDRSYSIYMVHAPLFALGFLLLGPAPMAWQLPVMIAGICAVLVLSDLSYRRLESPARRWINANGAHLARRLWHVLDTPPKPARAGICAQCSTAAVPAGVDRCDACQAKAW